MNNTNDLAILKYYKNGNVLCGFEGVHDNLCKNGYLDDDLELTAKGREFISKYQHWDNVKEYENKVYIRIKPIIK